MELKGAAVQTDIDFVVNSQGRKSSKHVFHGGFGICHSLGELVVVRLNKAHAIKPKTAIRAKE